MSGRPLHCVLLRCPERFEPLTVAAVLARRRGVPPEPLIPAARAAWGLPVEGLPAEEAEELAAELAAAGQDALAVPSALVEALPDPVPVTRLSLAGDGLDVVAAKEGAPRERLLWNHLRVVCAGEFEDRAARGAGAAPTLLGRAARLAMGLVTGLPSSRPPEEESRPQGPARRRVVELHFWEPARRLRVRADEFDYSLLGPEMTYSAEANFPLLLERLRAGAPRALRGRGTRSFLEQGPVSARAYDSLEDLGREGRWLLALSVLGAAR